ncbi:MAG: hypothetical protein Q8906_16480 [Bacillota bacterium]|nr:hypothetical protein [Bacillota bacterium]
MVFLPTKINLGDMKINEIGLGSNLSIGTTRAIGRNVSNKKSQGFGQQSADSTITIVPIVNVRDDDILDSIVYRQSN